MKSKTYKRITNEELNKKFRRRRRQLAFDNYPKGLQDFLTRAGMNPYKDDVEERIIYRDFDFTIKEK